MKSSRKKQQIGPRVKAESYEALERLAAANNCSLAYYCEQVLDEHIAHQQHPDAGGGVWQEILHEFDKRLAHQEAAHARELASLRLAMEKNLNAVKAMIDAHVQTVSPDKHRDYVKKVRDTLQAMRLTVGESNGSNGVLQ